MGIGGTIDMVAGYARRAPTLLQTLGLEWLDRLAREPRRLAPLYLSTNVPFAELPGRELLGARSPRGTPLTLAPVMGACAPALCGHRPGPARTEAAGP
jgi:N-acetylglucosaminyldiphosphoundecaprenol N-acetyl-beta-D-mannosaminyltransferase